MKLEKYMKVSGAFIRPAYKEVPEEGINNFKGNRENQVSNIIVNVTVTDGSFDFQGDELSQNRLVRSGWAMEKMNIPTIAWKTADNQIVNITVSDIALILLSAGEAQSALWF